MSNHQVSAGFEEAIAICKEALAHFVVEIDHNISAEDDVQRPFQRERWTGKVYLSECDEPTKVGTDSEFEIRNLRFKTGFLALIHFLEISVQNWFGHFFEFAGIIDAQLCFGEGGGVDIRSEQSGV